MAVACHIFLDVIDILQDVNEFCIFKLSYCSTATNAGRSTRQAPAWCFVRRGAALQAFKEIGGPDTGVTPSNAPTTLASPPALHLADTPVCVS